MGSQRTGRRALAVAAAGLASTAMASGCVGRLNATVPSTASVEPTTPSPSTNPSAPTAPAPTASAPTASVPTSAAPEGVEPSSDLFSKQQAVFYDQDGNPCDVCLWIAETNEQRQTGLMGVTTLGGADGMAFLYDSPTNGSFWMKGTVIELEIVFFDADGESVGGAHMTPCVTSDCELYGPDIPFSTAVEFPVGHLDELGISELERVEILDAPCSGVGV